MPKLNNGFPVSYSNSLSLIIISQVSFIPQFVHWFVSKASLLELLKFDRCSVFALEALRRLVLHQRKLRRGLFDAQAPIQHVPLGGVILYLTRLLLLLLLRSHGQLLKLVSVNFHVRANHLVRDCRHSLIPVLLLRAMEQSLDNDWVGLRHIVLDQLLNSLRVKHKESTFGGLVVHALTCQKKTAQKLRPKLIELLVDQVSHQVEHFFDFLDENDLLGWASYGPEFEQALDQRYM